MKEKIELKIAQSILNIVGKENILSMTHCATRLRLQVKDRESIDDSSIQEIEGVKGVFYTAGQYQIILGSGVVNRVYGLLMDEHSFAESSKAEMELEGGNKLQRAIRNVADIFVPIIPIIGATGLFLGLKGVLLNNLVLGMFGLAQDSIPQWLLA
ncbi:MAG: glucose PTS transporter subunit EIIB, partial [Cetobacterium sp.]